MCAGLSGGVAILLLGASATSAHGQAALRGSVGDAPVVEGEEGATLDALSEIFFTVEDGSIETSESQFKNSTASPLGLSANAASEMTKCSQGWSGMVEGIAPGCLGQCQKYGICQSIGSVLGVWLRTHNKKKAKHQACQNKQAFDCLLWSSHRGKCQPLINRAPQYGLPTSVHQACPRRLDETPVENAPATIPPEAAEEDQGGHSSAELNQQEADTKLENVTIDALAMAALSSGTSGCFCSEGELRQCGGQCLTKKGQARADCVATCLDGKNHAHSCSECYGRRTDCTLSNCFSKCALRPKSTGCLNCVHANCGGDCR